MQDNTGNPGEAPRPSDDDVQRSKAKIEALRERELPQMVDWFDPLLLVKVGIRTVLSKTIGDYADQRPMQAAHDDPDDENVLCQRHDYRNTRPNLYGVSPGQDPNKTLRFDADGALWVDFIADLGDGFEATYAMAYLMAKSKLDVAGIPKDEAPDGLPAGEFLIFGGDLAYPDATIKEYNDRCVTPYNNAFQMKEMETPKRKLYFISGNHDWYDGLAAFTSVFCAARDRFSKGKGKKIGGWQCEQRRSYFALGLPYGWWVWGIDLALNVTIDDAQKDYFEMMSQRTKPGEKVIIILHAPLWQLNEDMTHLHDISELARNRGAEVVAVLAGDLHFYSRYHTQSEKLDLQLITSGGGGAFAHPTHQEPLKLKVVWPLPKDNLALPHREADYVDTQISFSAEQEYTADYTALPPASDPQTQPPVEAAARRLFDPTHEHNFKAPAHFYPTRLKSRFLSLKNLWLPFHNRRLAIFLGVVYMLYAWVFQITVVDPTVAIKNAAFLEMEKTCRFISLPVDLDACLVKGRSEVNARHKRIFNPEAPGTIKSMRDEAKAKTAKPATTDPSSTPPTTTPAPFPATDPAQGQSGEQPPNPILKKFEKIWPEYLALWDKPFGLVRVVTRGAKDSFYWFVAPNFSPTRISQAHAQQSGIVLPDFCAVDRARKLCGYKVQKLVDQMAAETGSWHAAFCHPSWSFAGNQRDL